MAGLPREVIKWLQSLDLTHQVRSPKWDFSNGYLIGQILAWYHPRELDVLYFNDGESTQSKLLNWSLIDKFIDDKKLDVSRELREGTFHRKEGAAVMLVAQLYQILCHKNISAPPPSGEIDFTDRAYQLQLPYHARSTASKAVKDNLKISEAITDPNVFLNRKKAATFINSTLEMRRQERTEDPIRCGRKPAVGDKTLRQIPNPTRVHDESNASDDS